MQVVDVDGLLDIVVRAGGQRAHPVAAGIQAGDQGLVKIGALRPHLLFLDVMMPGIDGLEVARRLPAIEGLDALRVIFVTSSRSQDVLARAAALGNAVLAKPLELADLSRAMTDVLEGSARP